MNRSLVPFLLGACALATSLVVVRLVAPFYGLGPLLIASALSISLAALAAGFLLAELPVMSESPAHAPAAGTLVAGAWTIAMPWIAAPLLGMLERLGLVPATILGLAICLAPAFLGVGFALARGAASTGAVDPRASGTPIAALLFGAALAAPLTFWVLVPYVGVSRTLLAIGGGETLVGALAYLGARGRGPAVAAAALCALAALSAFRFPAVMRDPRHGLVEAREGATQQYRVVDREDGRFLLADGGIQTMVSSETREALFRPAAALQVLDFLYARPESALVLGLRGGTIARRFARAGWQVRVVDPDPAALVVATAHLSFHTEEVPITIADLRTFCRRTTTRYPLVILDAYDTSAIPFHLITREALATVASHVTPNGILGVVIVTHGWQDPVIRSLAGMLRHTFDDVLALPTSEPPDALGSIVLLASNRKLAIPEARLPQPTDYLMNPEDLWTVSQLNHAWFNRFDAPTDGAVMLTDDLNPIDLWSDPVQQAARADLHRSFSKPPFSW